MKTKISRLKLIYNILTTIEEAKDDWLLTIKIVHDYEMVNAGIKKSEYYESLFEKKTLTNVRGIIRDYSKVQQDNEHLRGDKWEERQKYSINYNKEYTKNNQYEYSLFSNEDLESMAKMDL